MTTGGTTLRQLAGDLIGELRRLDRRITTAAEGLTNSVTAHRRDPHRTARDRCSHRGLVSDPAAPFGGTKQRGIGREGSEEGIREFVETKYLAIAW